MRCRIERSVAIQCHAKKKTILTLHYNGSLVIPNQVDLVAVDHQEHRLVLGMGNELYVQLKTRIQLIYYTCYLSFLSKWVDEILVYNFALS